MPVPTEHVLPYLSVLLVEHNPVTRWVVRRTLECVGYEVAEAAEGKTALDRAARFAPDVILQGLYLPDIDGADLVRALKARPGGAATAVIAFGEDPDGQAKPRATAAGITGFVHKPFLPSHLVQTLQFYLKSRGITPSRPVSVERARLSQESYSERARKLGKPAAVRGQQILVVDDNSDERRHMAARLGEAGFQVAMAANGVAALKQAMASLPAAIVSDTLMPAMDGFELCLTARLVYPLALVPILLTPTGHIDELDREIGQSLGANAVVSRRPDFHKVIDALRIILDQEPPPLSREPGQLPADRQQLLLQFRPV
jgi:CheY-like chemotaxis protein